MNKRLLVACLLALATSFAGLAAPGADDAALEARVAAIAEELRCLVCQNQTIADSNAGLAVDLRNQVRDMLRRGMSDREVTDFMVQRYGDFVLYRPPMNGKTLLLWIGPFALFVIGLAVLFFKLRKRMAAGQGALSEQQRAAAARLLAARPDRTP